MHGRQVWTEARGAAVIAAHAGQPGALLPILHAVQEEFGHIPPAAVPLIARALNLSRAEVHGVVTFYADFRQAPPGRHVLKLCRAEACQSRGAEALGQHACRRLAVEWGGTSADGEVTLEAVYCLGLCATAPAALFDGRPVGRLTPDRLDQVLAPLEGTP